MSMNRDYDAVAVAEAVTSVTEALTQGASMEDALKTVLTQAWQEGEDAGERYHRGSYREGNPYREEAE